MENEYGLLDVSWVGVVLWCFECIDEYGLFVFYFVEVDSVFVVFLVVGNYVYLLIDGL